MLGTKVTIHVVLMTALLAARTAFLIWFVAWVIDRFEMLEKIGAWFRE